jgi:putative tryptophan/tyrosine transport system substrate-binding protein
MASRKVNVIATSGGNAPALAAKAATATLLIVFQVGIDPVEIGLADSIAAFGLCRSDSD